MTSIRIIPFPGPALEYEGPDSRRTLLSSTERGFLIGPENYALEPVIRWVLDGTILEEQLPVLLYGPVGSGRTHLLRGLFNAWQSNPPKDAKRKHSYYLPASDFLRQFSDALATKTPDDFRRRYRKAALLVLDDIHLFDGYPWVQEELLHTLDTLGKNGGLAVLSSDALPGAASGASHSGIFPAIPALTARLLGGTTLPVHWPGLETRKRFLRDLTAAFRLKLSDAVLELAARELPLSIPALYGTFTQMSFEADVEKKRIDAASVKRFLKNKVQNDQPEMAQLAKRTAKHFSLKLSDLRGSSRNKTIALARSIAIFLARNQANTPITDIARYFGKRDPSTIRHALDKIVGHLPDDVTIRDHLYLLGWR